VASILLTVERRNDVIWRPNILLVTPTTSLAAYVLAWLTDAGCRVTIVTSFSAAKAHVDCGPALMISEVRLSEYNGLHLALRAQLRSVPAIILGDADPVMKAEAEKLGATYLPRQIDRQRLVEAVEPIILAATPRDMPAPIIADNLCFVSSRDFAVPMRPTRDIAGRPMHS